MDKLASHFLHVINHIELGTWLHLSPTKVIRKSLGNRRKPRYMVHLADLEDCVLYDDQPIGMWLGPASLKYEISRTLTSKRAKLVRT